MTDLKERQLACLEALAALQERLDSHWQERRKQSATFSHLPRRPLPQQPPIARLARGQASLGCVSEKLQRVADAARDLGVEGQLVRVEPGYYDRGLSERAREIGATSTDQLCKTLIMRNVREETKDNVIEGVPSLVAVIVQYNQKVHAKKIARAVQAGFAPPGTVLKSLHYQSAPAEEALSITGFDFNGMAPVGLVEPIPLVLSHHVAELSPSMFFCGGGEPDVKMLVVGVDQFVRATNAHVADVTS